MIRERKQIPKQDRLAQFRNDSVDEVDTTDLEFWSLKRGKRVYQEIEDEREVDDLIKYMSDEEVTDEENARIDDLTHDLHVRHRIDIAKMHFGKDGGYSLRKFKRIFKREMAEIPHLYFIDRPGKKGSKKEKSEIEAALGEIDLDSPENKPKKEDGAA